MNAPSTHRQIIRAKTQSQDAAWQIVRDDMDLSNPASETLFALSNGFFGMRGGLNEFKTQTNNIFIAQIYDNSPIDYHERFPGFARKTDTRIPIADPRKIKLEVQINEDWLDASNGDLKHIERTLDMRNAKYDRQTIWTIGNDEIHLFANHIAPFDYPKSFAFEINIQSKNTSPIRLTSYIEDALFAAQKSDDPRLGIGAKPLKTIIKGHDEIGQYIVQETNESAQRIAIYATHSTNGYFLKNGDYIIQSSNNIVGFEKYIGFEIGDLNTEIEVLIANAKSNALALKKLGFKKICEKQSQTLGKIWNQCEAFIKPKSKSIELETALKFNQFQIIQAAGLGAKTSIAAKGLSGEGYEGHVFWDTEIFVFPTLLFTHPKAAKDLLLYRFNHLDGARKHAIEMNHKNGALYPWRTIGGDECSGYFLAGSAQYHINADIAYAIGLYWDATQDWEFMVKYGAQILFETARIWPQIGFFNPRRNGAFCIHAVTGPDEYTALVNDNFYTNSIAKAHLLRSVEIYEKFKKDNPFLLVKLCNEISLSDNEIEVWRKAADKMLLLYDEALGINAQDENFLNRAHFDFEDAKGKNPLLLNYHPLTLYRYQICKQADVVLADILCPKGNLEIATRNFDYYEAITSHDSTLSYASYATQAARLGKTQKALEYFEENLLIDLKNLHGNTDHGGHMAAMAGSWQALVYGFGGMEIKNGALSFAPSIPDEWDEWGAMVHFRGAILKMDINQQIAAFKNFGEDIEIIILGKKYFIGNGGKKEISINKNSEIKAIIFDLDGVITDTAKAHFIAWGKIAKELNIAFNEQDNEKLKGVDREQSLELLLKLGGIELSSERKRQICEIKNQYYLEEISHFNENDILDGAKSALEFCKKNGYKTALASASKNAALLLSKLNIANYFDFVADAGKSKRSKPYPDIFLACLDGLGLQPQNAIGVEDSQAGLDAIKSANMRAISVGEIENLMGADCHINNMTEFKKSLCDWGIPPQG